MGDPVFTAHRQQVAELATARRVPIVTGTSEYAQAGALITYGPSYPALARRSAVYVDKILKGARPAELPVEEPTTFELVVNLKAARTLGVAVPRSLLARADRVIE
jgi:putative ABC transport system substrate-binding protein